MGEEAAEVAWAFPAFFRAKAFGWRDSALACQCIQAAVTEITRTARSHPVQGAEGALLFLEKVAPALEQVDSSSGAVGSAVRHALEKLCPILGRAHVPRPVREGWLERLWTALEKDGMAYLDTLGEWWGELCGDAETASWWADRELESIRAYWTHRERGHYRETSACLSCLLAAGRHDDLLNLLEAAPFRWWSDHKFGFQALVAQGKVGEALAYARSCESFNDQVEIARACEGLLLRHGLHEEAYRRYALRANTSNTRLNTYRAMAKKYPMKEPDVLLRDLIAWSPGDEGKWFATARQLGFLDLAMDLAQRSPCDPLTLNRAARELSEEHPAFTLTVALAALRWLCEGFGYEYTDADVRLTRELALTAAKRLGEEPQTLERIQALVSHDQSKGKFVQKALGMVQRKKPSRNLSPVPR